MFIKNGAEVFFYVNITANFSSGGMGFLLVAWTFFWWHGRSSGGTKFLILLSLNVRLRPSKTRSLSNFAPDVLKYLKLFFFTCLNVFVHGVEFSF